MTLVCGQIPSKSASFRHANGWIYVVGMVLSLTQKNSALLRILSSSAVFEIYLDKVKPCSRYLDAICQFPTPSTITDIRSWFGLINQVTYYASMTDKMCPSRDLLKPKTPFYLDHQLQQLFEESKAVHSRVYPTWNHNI